MRSLIIKILLISVFCNYIFKAKPIYAIVPYYYMPTIKNLENESLSIGKTAYQLLYFGQFRDSLNVAKLAVTINKNNEKLWMILSEAQIANKLYEDALNSLKIAEKINPEIFENYSILLSIHYFSFVSVVTSPCVSRRTPCSSIQRKPAVSAVDDHSCRMIRAALDDQALL